MVDPSQLDPDGIARREFTTAFRGFDQVEVRGFLTTLSMQVRHLVDREAELARRVVELERRTTEAEAPDEHRLTELLGEETARIFEAAREAAAEIRAKAEAKTAQLVRDAQDEASRMTSEAAEVLRLRTTEADTAASAIVSDAEAERDRILAEAEAAAEAMRTEAAADAEAMRGGSRQVLEQAELDAAAAVEEGRRQGREMVAEAQVVRERILKDLARRRRAGKAQLEQLRAARERLLDAYALVRRTLEEATTELSVAVPEAKLAAEAAGRRVELDDDELTVEAIEAELDAGRVAGVPLLDTGEIPVTRIRDLAPGPEREPSPEPEREGEAGDNPETELQAERDAEVDPEAGERSEPVAPPPALSLVDDLPDLDDGDRGDEPEPEHELAEPIVDLTPDEAVDGDVSAGDDGATVSDLFARIRSEVPSPDADSDVVDADSGDDTDAADAVDADSDVVDVTDGSAEPDPGGHAEDADEDADESVLERRDRYLIGLEADLTRALKRQLADDENDKLDLIRRRPAKTVATDLLPSIEEHRSLFVDAVTVTLALAARSGGEFALDLLEPDREADDSPVDRGVPVADLAAELTDSLLIPIRDRVSELAADTDPDDALDGVRACYRRWKGAIADLAAQYVHTAFNRGVYHATPDGGTVRWIVDPGAGPCPDGEDDALEGPIEKGTPFPTGHLHPPAHPGCRCLLVPGVL